MDILCLSFYYSSRVGRAAVDFLLDKVCYRLQRMRQPVHFGGAKSSDKRISDSLFSGSSEKLLDFEIRNRLEVSRAVRPYGMAEARARKSGFFCSTRVDNLLGAPVKLLSSANFATFKRNGLRASSHTLPSEGVSGKGSFDFPRGNVVLRWCGTSGGR
jgi:hypothetical protein